MQNILEVPLKNLERRSIAVIGGGLIGLCTAYSALARSQGQVKVSLYEAAEVGHPGAASSDVNRVFRHLNGPDPILTSWALEARDIWNYLETLGGSCLLHRVGVVFLVHQRQGSSLKGHHVWPYELPENWLDDSIRILNDYKIPYKHMTPSKLPLVYPQFDTSSLSQAVLDPEAGFLDASKALSILLEQSLKAGVEYHPHNKVVRVELSRDGCILYVQRGKEMREIHVETVVIATNGWMGDLLPLPVGTLMLAEQPLVYLTLPKSNRDFIAGKMPVFISLSNDCYGIPSQNGNMKIANDNPYRGIDHPDQRDKPDDNYIEQVINTVSDFIPGLRTATVEKIHVCFYDRSKDDRFILDCWDKDARIIYGCGMSGRAFKFGPVIGERLARFAITGQRPADLLHFQTQ